jgi:hypothetical protein
MDDVALELPWDKYQAMILPDYQAVSDALAERIDRFVANGGVLIASGRSGFRDESYEPRAIPALKSLGIEQVERVREDMRSSYFKLDDKRGLSRFADVDLVYLDGPYVYAQFAESAEQRFKLIPPHNFGPPERCYYTQVTERPGLIINPYGKGKAVYFPWLPGALFHRQGYPNTSEFVADVLENIAGITPLGGNLSPMVEVTRYGRMDGGYELLHLVNGSGHFGVSFFAPVTMQDLEVVVPREAAAKSVQSLAAKQDYQHTWKDGQLTIRVPQLRLFDAIRIE